MRKLCRGFLAVFFCLLTLTACSPTPQDSDVAAAIRTSLIAEQDAPDLVVDDMEVLSRSAGEAVAVLWTADKTIQRNYTLVYNKEAKTFVVSGYTTSVLSEDGIYRPQPPAPLTEYASRFGLTGDTGERLRLIYIGQRSSAVDARAQYEATALADLTPEQLAEFGTCDLGGDTLVLIVPKYEGTVLSIIEVETMGDALMQGNEVGRFENGKPAYLWYNWNGTYDITVMLNGSGGFIHGCEDVLDRCTKAENGCIY